MVSARREGGLQFCLAVAISSSVTARHIAARVGGFAQLAQVITERVAVLLAGYFLPKPNE